MVGCLPLWSKQARIEGMNIPYGPILVVEDNPNVRELLEVTLHFKGYPVVSVENGQAALEFIAREHPALIVTDILMPKMDGFALVHTLRKDPRTTRIPVIFISATYITPEDKAFAMSLGAVRFIEKPIDTEDFLLTVAEVLTEDLAVMPPPLDDLEFYRGYRERLEHKLRHKQMQLTRIERLLQTLPEEQRPAFELLRARTLEDRDQIQRELNQLYRILDEQGRLSAAGSF